MNVFKEFGGRLLCAVAGMWSVSSFGEVTVTESAREIPVLEKTDVLVVGGGFAAASAAIAAKNAGADVFVVMPRQNPAEDLVSTRRLWVEAGDEQLDDLLIADVFPLLSTMSFDYVPSVTAVSPHEDSGRNILRDGVWNSAQYNSAQYGTKDSPCGSVTLTVTPDDGVDIVCVKVYYYSGDSVDYGSFDTAGISVSANGVAIPGSYEQASSNDFKVHVFRPTEPIAASTVLTITATTAEGSVRQLIGEIVLESPDEVRQTSTKPTYLYHAIDTALSEAGIPYFTGAPVCDVIPATDGRLAGVVVANRNGRQALLAKTIVDATEWGLVARRAAALREGPASTEFTQVVTLAGDAELTLPEGYVATEVPSQIRMVAIADNKPSNDAPASYDAKTLAVRRTFPLAATDAFAVNAILHTMRNDLWHKSVADWSEKPFFVPPEAIVSKAGESQALGDGGVAALPLAACRPAAVDNLYVAGALADVSRADAKRLMALGASVVLGRRLGAAAAADAATAAEATPVTPAADSPAAQGPAVRESVSRPLHVGTGTDTLAVAGGTLPVLAETDVVVVGGGTAGAPAAIAAAGEGRDVTVVEWIYGLGGTTTEGRIATYYHGNVRGFTKTIDAGTRTGSAIGWVFSETKSEWFRRKAVEKGATVLYGSFVEGALVDGVDDAGRARVCGVVVVLPDGTRGAVTAKVVIDSTGNADVAASAGAETTFLDASEFAMQGCAASPHRIGRNYYNTDVGFLNGPDAGDLFTFALRARLGLSLEKDWNLSHVHVGARERRRIIGDWVVTPEDELTDRRYADTIMHGKSDYDMHGFSTTPLMMFHNRPKGTTYSADLPYRALIPRTLEGMLVTGLAVSADRDAMPIIRMQPDVQNQGYAAGLAAAAACDADGVREIDVRALQQKLVNSGNLDARVLTDTDSGLDATKLATAVEALNLDFLDLPWILAYPTEALPLVQAEFAEAQEGAHRTALACALLLLGDDDGFDVVANAFAAADVTAGSNFKGLGNYGRQTSAFDMYLYALAASGNQKAEAVIARRLPELVGTDQSNTIRPMSHYRMAALAAERLKSERIVAQLKILASRNENLEERWKLDPITKVTYSGENDMDTERMQTIRELACLRARYRFGDAEAEEGLRTYLGDYRTIYASYAALALGQSQLGTAVGTWINPDQLLIDFGKPLYPNEAKGRVSVVDATVTLRGRPNLAYDDVDYELVPDGSFEPTDGKTDITGGDISKRDKRGSDAQAVFVPAHWNFPNKGSGIATDGSYFMKVDNAVRTANLSGAGQYAAFLAAKPGDSLYGSIVQTVTINEAGYYRLGFYVGSRSYDKNVYNVQVKTWLDGVELDTYPETAGKVASWTFHEVDLGELAVGAHEIKFTAPSGVGELWSMIDLVQIGVTQESEASTAFAANQFSGLHLDIGEGAELQLDLEGLDPVRIGGLRVGGRTVTGVVSGDSEYATGSGAVFMSRPGTQIIIH